MVYDHEIHLLRILLLESVKHARESDLNKIHINALRHRSAKFLDITKVKSGIEMLLLSGEVVSFGMGWYGLSPHINIPEHQISIGWNGREPDELYRQAYNIGNSDLNISLNSWLGPPFSFDVTNGNVFLDLPNNNECSLISSAEIYWADVNSNRTDSNWLNGKENPPRVSGNALYRVDKDFFNDFYNSFNSNINKIKPNDAYELASIKDCLRGLKYPYVYDFKDDWIVVKPKRYVSKSMKKMAFLLSSAVEINGLGFIYYFTEKSFNKFKSHSEKYAIFFKERL